MGNNCPSGFRGKFTPGQEFGGKNGVVSEMKMKPVDVDHYVDGITFCAEDSDNSIPMMDGVELTKSVSSDYVNGDDEIDKKDAKSTPLICEDVDLCVATNAASHRTASFYRVRQEGKLVVRRGAPFRLDLELNRTHDQERDILCLVFISKDAASPSYSQNTEILLPVLSPDDEKKEHLPAAAWRVQITETKGKTLCLEVTPSNVCIVGEWRVEVDSRSKEDKDAPGFRYQVPDAIVLLFNPWCEGDAVFLDDEEKRTEYVLSDSGLVWRGSHNCIRPCIWNYAQFEENILECCLYLLSNVGHLKIVDRADPVAIVRHISSVLNSRSGKSGVLVSDWSGKYKKGKSPTDWGGSQLILQKYFKSKRPLKYGQCWVYAGLFTTVCRALGIPSRPVTNFSSAHDTHGSLTVDRYFDAKGQPLEHMDTDSLWNFHAWCESWMARPDLEPGGYGGWQAADCTPQDESDGVFRCGPASVAAVRRGEVQRPFDTSTLFAEVNADKVYWGYHGPHHPLKLIRKDSEGIGQCISTKAVGKYEREDITHEYKYIKERGEREAMLRALRQCGDSFSRYCLNEDSNDVRFELAVLDDIMIGSPFTVKLKASDKRVDEGENKEYSVRVSLHVHSVLYTGQSRKLVKRDEFEIQMAPGVENVMKMVVPYEEYCGGLRDQCSFVVSASAHVEQTGFDFCAQEDFRVRMPDIGIQVDGEIVVDHPVTVTATLTNPLPGPLRSGEFILEGPGFGQPTKIKIKRAVAAGSEAKAKRRLTPSVAGSKVVIAKFRSRELRDCDGYHVVVVKPSTTVTSDTPM